MYKIVYDYYEEENLGDCNQNCDACEHYSPDRYNACCGEGCEVCTCTQFEHAECCGGTVIYIHALNKLICDTCAWEKEGVM